MAHDAIRLSLQPKKSEEGEEPEEAKQSWVVCEQAHESEQSEEAEVACLPAVVLFHSGTHIFSLINILAVLCDASFFVFG